jgi:hypothetical protein
LAAGPVGPLARLISVRTFGAARDQGDGDDTDEA